MPNDKQRREAERRRLQRQLQRRAERAESRRRISLIATIVGVVVVAAVVVIFLVATNNDNAKKSAKTPAPTPAAPSTTSQAAATGCTWTNTGNPARQVKVPPTTNPPKTGTTTATVKTNRGTMTFSLDRTAAPCAVESFVSLAQQKYFDNTPCHRITSTGGLYVLQCGDPSGTGRGGPGYSFKDELTGKEQYTQGVLAMANSGPNTNGSQFFIVYKNSQLGPQYTVFGHVTKGLDVVSKVAAQGSSPAGDGKPKEPISITKVTTG